MNAVVKALVEGLAIAVAAFYIPGRRSNLQDVAMIGLAAAATLLVIDNFAPAVSGGMRQGAGFGVGQGMVGGGPVGAPFNWE